MGISSYLRRASLCSRKMSRSYIPSSWEEYEKELLSVA